MVVYRKETSSSDTLTGNTAAQSVEDSTNEAGKTAAPISHMVPRAILTSRPNSHPFQERHLILDQAIKVGRSVARCRPATSNAIFDCKVLSRNHALLWYENGKFYLQDTKSSNGTFVNNQRLSKGSEESPAQEVCSGDIVQFGVDVVENSRKFVHGCIVATLKLYLPDGKEAKASPTTAVVPLSPETSISSQEIYQLSQYLQEALHREQILECKLGTLQKVVANTQDEADIGWKALIEEDRLLSRIETLESQLQTCGKNITEEKLKDDVMKLQDDKDKYQMAAKESLKKVLQEKLEAIGKVQDLENSLSNTESECSHLGEINKQKEEEIQVLLEKTTESEKEIASLTKKLQELEDKYQDLVSQTNEDKLALENNAEEIRKEEQIILSTKIEALQAENDFAKEQLSAMKAHYDILKKDQNNDETIEGNGNLSSNAEINKSSDEQLPGDTIRVCVDGKGENVTPGSFVPYCSMSDAQLSFLDHKDAVKLFGGNLVESKALKDDVSSTHTDSEEDDLLQELQYEVMRRRVQKENLKNEALHSEKDEYTSNGETKPEGYVNNLEDEIKKLKKSINELKDINKFASRAQRETTEELDELRELVKTKDAELNHVQEQLSLVRQHIIEKTEQVEILESKLKFMLSEKNQGNSKELATDSVSDSHPLSLKHSSSDEKLSGVGGGDYVDAKLNYISSTENCAIVESKSRENIFENSLSEAQSKALPESCTNLEMEGQTKKREGYYFDENTVINKSELDIKEQKLLEAQEEIILIKERFEECNKEKSYLQGELHALKEELQLLSIQSKTVSVCSIIPLTILLVAMMLAFYPTLSHFTATSDQM